MASVSDSPLTCPSCTWRLDICEAAGGRFFLIEPHRGVRWKTRAPQRQETLGCPGSSIPPFVPSPPKALLVLGERARVRGQDRAH